MVLVRIAAMFVFALVGVVLGLALAGPEDYETPLGIVQIEIEPSPSGGAAEVFVPNLKAGVESAAFAAPLRARVVPLNINPVTIAQAAIGRPQVLTQTRDDLIAAGVAAILRACLWALGGVLVAALALYAVFTLLHEPRAGLFALGTVGIGLIAIVLMGLWVGATLDIDKFTDPTLTGDPSPVVVRTVAQLKKARNTADVIKGFVPLLREFRNNQGSALPPRATWALAPVASCTPIRGGPPAGARCGPLACRLTC